MYAILAAAHWADAVGVCPGHIAAKGEVFLVAARGAVVITVKIAFARAQRVDLRFNPDAFA